MSLALVAAAAAAAAAAVAAGTASAQMAIQTHEYVGSCGGHPGIEVDETVLTNTQLGHVVWLNSASDIALARTTHPHDVLRTTNGGKTWVDESPKLANFHSDPLYGNVGVQGLWVSPANDRTAYLLGWNGKVWSTQDSGSTYQAYQGPANMTSLLPHPTQAGWVLAFSPGAACYRGVAGDCFWSALLSQNFGATWTTVDTYVRRVAWGDAGSPGVPDTTIWTLAHKTKTGVQSRLPYTDLELFHSTDLMRTHQPHPLTGVIDFLYLQGVHYAAVINADRTTLRLYTSENDGTTWNLARFPMNERLVESMYYILQDTDVGGGSFIAIVHNSRERTTTTYLYQSGSLAENFTLALPFLNVDRTYTFAPEFHRIKGLNGLYLANQVYDVTPGQQDPPVGTQMSRNGGSEWRELTSPEHMCPGMAAACRELQLHSSTFYEERSYAPFGPLHSNEHALGLVVATGNVGRSLLVEPDACTTFISEDAGWSWKSLVNHPTIAGFADHGGLLLLGRTDQMTDELIYTWDRGASLAHCGLGGPGLAISGADIYNILTKPSPGARSFIVNGRVNGTNDGLLLHVDFTRMRERQCGPADFEDFTPPGPNGPGSCLDGETRIYRRRKPHANCSNAEATEKLVSVTACACTADDFECDYCFEPSMDVPGTCVPASGCPAVGGCVTGFRKIPSNKCVGGIDKTVSSDPNCGRTSGNHGPAPASEGDHAGAHSPAGSAGGVVAVIVVLVLVLAGAMGAFWYFKVRTHPAGWAGAIGDLTSGGGAGAGGGHRFEPLNAGGDDDLGTALDDDLLDDDGLGGGGGAGGDDDAPTSINADGSGADDDDDLLI